MSERRPYTERPAARPSQPLPPIRSPGAFAAQKKGIGCLGMLLILTAVIIVIVIFATVVSSATQSNGPNQSSTTSNQDSSSDTGFAGESVDPIEQARVVLGGAHSYATVKQATDAALSATGTAVDDDSRSRAWSAVLRVTNSLDGVDPMAVMQCVPGLGEAAAGSLDFPEAAALCATELAVG